MSVLTPADLELLSAYLDDALTAQERAALERRLAAEPALHTELEALREVVSRVRALPTLPAPRDFRLDPAVYGRKAPRLAQPRRVSASRVYYRWGSALSALAAAIMLAIGVLGVLEPPFLSNAPAAVQQQVDQEELGAASRMMEEPPQVAALPTPSPAVTAAEENAVEDSAAEMPAEAEALFGEPTGVHFGRGGAGPLGDKPGAATGAAEPPIALQAPGVMPSPLPPGVSVFSAEAAADSGLADDATFATGEGAVAADAAGAAAAAVAADAADDTEADTGPVETPSPKSDPLPATLSVPTPAELVEIVPPAFAAEGGARVAAPPAAPASPAILIGAGVALLALAGVFLALSRRK